MTLTKFRNNDFPAIWNEFFGKDLFDYGRSMASKAKGTLPAVNVKETEDGFSLEVAAPGMKKDDFIVELDKNQLKISAEIKEENEAKGENYTRREFNYQSFQRYFSLPESVVGEKITAKYEDGLLMVFVPKKEEAKEKGPKAIKVG